MQVANGKWKQQVQMIDGHVSRSGVSHIDLMVRSADQPPRAPTNTFPGNQWQVRDTPAAVRSPPSGLHTTVFTESLTPFEDGIKQQNKKIKTVDDKNLANQNRENNNEYSD